MNSKPDVSVIMPVYNAEGYLSSALESIINQSFKNFEFIIINDGSTDSSLKIIKEFAKKDPRIQIISHKNKGYATALNEGIVLAEGKYIARMDADDISLKERFKEQVAYLNLHPECAVLATRIQPIDESGSYIEEWPADQKALSLSEIRATMPTENCIAHPSVMARAKVMKSYRYDVSQTPTEDYDLWLRVLSDKLQIHKLKDKLVLYRIHPASVSQTSIRESSVQRKYLRAKSRFLVKQLKGGKLGSMEIRVFYSFMSLFMSMASRKILFYFAKTFSRCSRVVMKLARFPCQLYLRIFPPKQRLLFVVPWMTIGGADKVLLDIISGLSKRSYKLFCISTVPSKNEWKSHFQQYCEEVVEADRLVSLEDIPGYIVEYAVKNSIDVVITSNNAAGYLAAAGLKMAIPALKIIDTIQGEGGKFEKGGWPLHSTPFDKLLDARIVPTQYMKSYLIRKYSIDSNKIFVIHNGISQKASKLPPPAKEFGKLHGKFIVLWAGRFGIEKHPELAIEAARLVTEKTQDVHFVLAGYGEMKEELKRMVKNYKLADSVTITNQPYKDFREYMAYSDVLLMTSETEGSPIVILEAFSLKRPVIAPRVGGIPELVEDSENGYLTEFSISLPKKTAEKILHLANHQDLGKKMGDRGNIKVRQAFSLDKMVADYEKVLLC